MKLRVSLAGPDDIICAEYNTEYNAGQRGKVFELCKEFQHLEACLKVSNLSSERRKILRFYSAMKDNTSD